MKTKFNNFNTEEPQVGDYIICKEDFRSELTYKIAIFINNNIGRVVRILSDKSDKNDKNDYFLYAKYDNIPTDIKDWFQDNVRMMFLEEIIFFSKDKEDCETYLTAKNFNL